MLPPNIGTGFFLQAEFDFGDDVLRSRSWELFYKRNVATLGSPRQKQDRFSHFELDLITFSTILENIFILLSINVGCERFGYSRGAKVTLQVLFENLVDIGIEEGWC